MLPWWAAATTPGEKLMLAGRLDDALPVVQAEARANQSDLDSQERYIDLLLTMELGSIAETNYRRRVAADSSNADSHYLLGRVVPTAPLAVAEYQRALQLDAEHARAYMGLGAVYRATGASGEAIDAYRLALQRDTSLGEAWGGLTIALLNQNRRGEALEAARLHMLNVPGEAGGYLVVAELRPDEAAAVTAQAVTAAPDDPRVHAAMAEIELLAGRGKQAREAGVAALTIAPGHIGARLTVMFAHAMEQGTLDAEGYKAMVIAQNISQSDPEKAREAYDLLVQSYPKCPLVYMGRSRVPRGIDAAITDVRKALELDPQMSEAQAALGLLLMQTGDFKGALMALDQAIVARPFDISLLIMSAKAAGELDSTASLSRLEQAWTTFPSDVRLALVYAQYLSAAGGHERAIEILAKTANKVPDPKLGVALASVAKDGELVTLGAQTLDELATSTGNATFAAIATSLRDGGAGK